VKVTVGSVTPSSEVPGYDSIAVKLDDGGKQKDYTFLLSKDRATMLRVTKFDLSKDAYSDLMSKIDVTGRPSRGAKGAKVVVVNFDDFECPFCSRMHETLFPQIFKEYGDRVTFIYKDYPLAEIHPWAIHAAVDAGCLAAQNGDASSQPAMNWGSIEAVDAVGAGPPVALAERSMRGRAVGIIAASDAADGALTVRAGAQSSAAMSCRMTAASPIGRSVLGAHCHQRGSCRRVQHGPTRSRTRDAKGPVVSSTRIMIERFVRRPLGSPRVRSEAWPG